MLVSRSKEGGMMDKLETVRRGGHGGQLGTLFELVRNKSDNTAHMNQYFGPAQLNSDWRYLSIAYIGVTGLSDEIIEDHAHNITRLHPKYNGFKNNCQNFIHYLLAHTCPGQSFPRTIQNVVDKALAILNDGQDGRETHGRVDQITFRCVFFL
jgi:hypothetical protein